MLDPKALFPNATPEKLRVLENAPKKRMTIIKENEYKESLATDDPRYVATTQARDDKFERHFYNSFGYDMDDGEFDPPDSRHVLFFGHVGCGKSTELAHLCKTLHHPDRYWVVSVNLIQLIDWHNVNYSDVWLAVAQILVQQLEREGIPIDEIILKRLQNWFTEKVFSDEKIKGFDVELKTEAEIGSGLPLIGKLLARFTGAIRTASTYRETIRRVVHNSYGEYISALNMLFSAAVSAIQFRNKGKQLLIAIDGPDRFRGDDWHKFFISDGIQLTQAQCVTVYTAPMALKSDGRLLASFENVVLPMVKLRDYPQDARREVAYTTMRQIILNRCHYGLFDRVETLDALIDYSGGHLRDALRLLTYACSELDGSQFEQATVDAAANRMAGDFRDWLQIRYYPILVAEDQKVKNLGCDEEINKLIEDGALLVYNSGTWRKTHPVIPLLAGYQHALAESNKLQSNPA